MSSVSIHAPIDATIISTADINWTVLAREKSAEKIDSQIVDQTPRLSVFVEWLSLTFIQNQQWSLLSCNTF